MTRYTICQRGLICLWLIAFSAFGCRLDNERSVEPDVETENGGESGSAGRSGDKTEGAGGGGNEGRPDDKTEGAAGGGSVDRSSNTLRGTVKDLVTDEPLADMRVVALSNDDPSKLGIEASTTVDGSFSLEGITDELICVEVAGTEGEDARVDSITCNIPSDQTDRSLFSVQFVVEEAIVKSCILRLFNKR